MRGRALVGAAVVVGLWGAPEAAAAERKALPLQFDISAGAMHQEDLRSPSAPPIAVGLGSLYVGWAGPAGPGQRMFAGGGVEGTIDGVNGPYQWSIGAGARAGTVWRLPESPVIPLPDGYFYGRVTPFLGMRSVASESYLGDRPKVTALGMGVRIGFGFTVPRWNAYSLGILSVGSGVHVHDADEAIACCAIALLAALLNHGELTYEIYRESGAVPTHRFGYRIGIGF